MPAGASRPAGTPVPSAQLLEPHSSASPPVLLHCVHHGCARALETRFFALWPTSVYGTENMKHVKFGSEAIWNVFLCILERI